MNDKFTWILSACIVLVVALTMFLLNSEAFITETMPIKNAQEQILKNNLKQSYSCKYENGFLKVKYELSGVDDKVFTLARKQFDDNEELVTLYFVDKGGFTVVEKRLEIKDFAQFEKGVYQAQTSILTDKKNIKKIATINTSYKTFLIYTYKQLEQQYIQKAKRQMAQLFY